MLVRRVITQAVSQSMLAQTALAGDVLVYGEGDLPDPRQVAAILNPSVSHAPTATRVRSLRLLTEATKAAAAPVLPALPAAAGTEHTATAEDIFSAFALPVKFSVDSARISQDTAAQLDAVAEGIKLAGADVKVVIEGHTDASGAGDYNVLLSLRRANIVKMYLVRKHGIMPDNLSVVGMGSSVPLNKKNPFAAENRRVEFRAEIA